MPVRLGLTIRRQYAILKLEVTMPEFIMVSLPRDYFDTTNIVEQVRTVFADGLDIPVYVVPNDLEIRMGDAAIEELIRMREEIDKVIKEMGYPYKLEPK